VLKHSVGGSSISFADGHVQFWKYADWQTADMAGNYTTYSVSVSSTSIKLGPAQLDAFHKASLADVQQLEAWSGGPMPPGLPQ
jgi:prepilin-type processing-associated H-X9-DG protein